MVFGRDTNPITGTQFEPGQSGNPAGQKPGTKHLSTWIQNMMNDEKFELFVTDPKVGYKKYEGAPVKAIVTVALTKAAAGDTKWADWLAKYGFGTKLELANNPDNPITSIDPQTAAEFAAFLKNKNK